MITNFNISTKLRGVIDTNGHTMSNLRPAVQIQRRLFLRSLGIIITVISFFEVLIMCFFEFLSGQWGIVIPPLPEAALDTGLLTLLSAPCLWYLSLRPLAMTIEQKQFEVDAKAQRNIELLADLEISRDAALQAAVTKSEFLANMSHEIRTPMNGVLGMLDLLKDTELTGEQLDLLATAANSAEALLDIINDILDFSKLESGRFCIEAIEFDLPSLVEEVCSLMASRAHNKGLELNCFVQTQLSQHWQGDPNRLRQILTNLIGNAVKFTELGEVSVTVSELPMQDGPGIRFDIQDTGIGISEGTQAWLFQPFSQADSSTARRFGGTGLGLSISRDLVNLMGGAIGLESVLGQGTTFWFTLPLVPIASKISTPCIELVGQRVLIVDDNATNRIILEHYLLHWELTVVQVDNAAAALDALDDAVLREEAFTFLLSDLHMPDMDGFALMRAINANPALAPLKKLLLSSGGLCSEAERKGLGIAQALLKPVRQTQLYTAMVNALQTSPTLSTAAIQQENSLPAYHDKRILVAEDNKVNQKVILAMLDRFQIQPDLVENGQAVLDQLAQQTYDLVLVDCQMPVMDGYEATRQIRAQEISRVKDHQDAPKHLTIVALTAHVSEGEREKCLAAGMDDYLSKPIEKGKLTSLLETWLGGASDQQSKHLPVQRPIVANGPSDWDEARTLQGLDGDKALLGDLVDLFVDDVPGHLTALTEARRLNDRQALAEIAHQIKGMAGHFFADTLIARAATLEDAARHSPHANFTELTDALISVAKPLVACLLQYRASRHG